MRRWPFRRGRPLSGRTAPSFRDDERAVSDILGNILLVAITVVLAGSFGALIIKIPGPVDKLHADLVVSISDGAGAWGDGDEEVRVTHRGGEEALADATTIAVRINDVLSSYSGVGDLGSAFGDGRLTIGETWSHAFLLDEGDNVAVDVLGSQAGVEGLVASTSLLAGEMLAAGFTATNYVTSFATTVGTVANFTNAQSGTDSGAEATIAETPVTTPIQGLLYAAAATASSGDPNTVEFPSRATGAPDDQYAIIKKNGAWVQTDTFSSSAGTITKVEVAFEGRYLGTLLDDQAVLSYSVTGAAGPTSIAFTPNAAADTQRFLDVTGDRGSWTWQNIADFEPRLTYQKVAALDAGVLLADSLWVRVTYSANADYTMDITLETASIPVATTQDLQLSYRRTGDTFHAQVWDGTGWTTRGAVLDQSSATAWSYALTGSEYNGGTVRVRFLDDTPSSPTQGKLFLDYLRVVSTG